MEKEMDIYEKAEKIEREVYKPIIEALNKLQAIDEADLMEVSKYFAGYGEAQTMDVYNELNRIVDELGIICNAE